MGMLDGERSEIRTDESKMGILDGERGEIRTQAKFWS